MAMVLVGAVVIVDVLRDQIYALIRAADQERRFRAWLVVEEGVPGEYELVV